jgi:hypothetical protein
LTDSLTQLVSELRRGLPASVSLCRDAITESDGDIRKAHDIVVRSLVDDVAVRTGISRAEANEFLTSASFDVERAVELWRMDNSPPEPTPQEKLVSGIELAASVPYSNPAMRRYAHVIPHSNGYELRLITHLARYTEESFGYDYDCAMQDRTTRLQRLFVDSVSSAINQLASWGCTDDMLVPPTSLDSCLVNSPLDAYLELSHLRLDDTTNTAEQR